MPMRSRLQELTFIRLARTILRAEPTPGQVSSSGRTPGQVHWSRTASSGAGMRS